MLTNDKDEIKIGSRVTVRPRELVRRKTPFGEKDTWQQQPLQHGIIVAENMFKYLVKFGTKSAWRFKSDVKAA